MGKGDVVYIYSYSMEYYSIMRKKEIMSFVTTWINFDGIMLNEINQTEGDKYCLI